MDEQTKQRAADLAALQIIAGALGMSGAAWMAFGHAAGLAVISLFLVGGGMRGLRG